MDTDTLLKSVAPMTGLVAAVATALVGAATWYLNRRTQLSQLSRNELEAVQSAVTTFSADAELSTFWHDVQKEKLCQLMFGCSIPIGEIGRLISYYRRGFATTAEICEAWEHRNEDPDALSFRLGWFERAMVFGLSIYCLFCVLMGMFAFVFAYVIGFFAHNLPLAAQTLGMSILLFAAAWGVQKTNRSLFTAHRLAEREKKHSQQP